MRSTIFLLGLFIALHSSAQTFDEWFHQKETQKKYLLEQIAALEIYLDYTAKGYQVAGAGLDLIHSIKSGDFQLHRDFFDRLRQVSPAIRKWSRVGDILRLQAAIAQTIQHRMALVKDAFPPEAQKYLSTVLDHLMRLSFQELDHLILVTTSGELQMSDAERIKRIEAIFRELQEQWEFIGNFTADLKLPGIYSNN